MKRITQNALSHKGNRSSPLARPPARPLSAPTDQPAVLQLYQRGILQDEPVSSPMAPPPIASREAMRQTSVGPHAGPPTYDDEVRRQGNSIMSNEFGFETGL